MKTIIVLLDALVMWREPSFMLSSLINHFQQIQFWQLNLIFLFLLLSPLISMFIHEHGKILRQNSLVFFSYIFSYLIFKIYIKIWLNYNLNLSKGFWLCSLITFWSIQRVRVSMLTTPTYFNVHLWACENLEIALVVFFSYIFFYLVFKIYIRVWLNYNLP